jgi:poly(3-hydroxybutyrate) depolymerase
LNVRFTAIKVFGMFALGAGGVTLTTYVLIGASFVSSEATDGVTSDGQHELLTVMGRTAHIYKPAALKAQRSGKLPAIFVLHGTGRFAKDALHKGFDTLADTHTFLVVYPEMEVPGGYEWGYSQDIPYFTALVDRLQENDYNLDATQAYLCGHSAGGSMALFLQNEVNLFRAVGAVEAAVGKLDEWDMSKPGHPTMVVWNHADPVLYEYAPGGDEAAYFRDTVSILRRHGDMNHYRIEQLPTSEEIIFAEVRHYPQERFAPQLRMLSFTSQPGTHSWATTSWSTFNATTELLKFFFEVGGIPISGLTPAKSGAWGREFPDAPHLSPMMAAWEAIVASAAGLLLEGAPTWILLLATLYVLSRLTVRIQRRCKKNRSDSQEWFLSPSLGYSIHEPLLSP